VPGICLRHTIGDVQWHGHVRLTTAGTQFDAGGGEGDDAPLLGTVALHIPLIGRFSLVFCEPPISACSTPMASFETSRRGRSADALARLT
jgi:hypothetical protein